MGLIQKAGQDPNSDVARLFGLGLCESAWLLQAAFQAGGALSAQGYLNGLARLGTTFPPVQEFSNAFSPGRRDAAHAARRLAFDDGCACWRYNGNDIPVP
jgi:hypothetical protein